MPNPQCGRIASETKGNKQVSVMLFSVFRTCQMSITPCARMWKDRGGSGRKRTGNNTLSLQLTDFTAMSDTDILTVIGDSGDAIVTPAGDLGPGHGHNGQRRHL